MNARIRQVLSILKRVINDMLSWESSQSWVMAYVNKWAKAYNYSVSERGVYRLEAPFPYEPMNQKQLQEWQQQHGMEGLTFINHYWHPLITMKLIHHYQSKKDRGRDTQNLHICWFWNPQDIPRPCFSNGTLWLPSCWVQTGLTFSTQNQSSARDSRTGWSSWGTVLATMKWAGFITTTIGFTTILS